MAHAQRLSALKEFNTKARRPPRQTSSAEAKDSRIREKVTIEEDLQAGLPEFESLRSRPRFTFRLRVVPSFIGTIGPSRDRTGGSGIVLLPFGGDLVTTMQLVLLIVVLLVVFGGGGGYYWSRRGH